MNVKAIKPLYMLLTLTLLMSMIPLFHNAAAQARPSVVVNPATNAFFSDTTHVGDTFSVSIVAADWVDPGVYSFEFKLGFDPALLQPVSGKTGVPSDGWITTFVAANATLDTNTLTYGATLLGDDKRVGGGILGVATFKILTLPPAGGSVGCNLSLIGVIMVNPTTTKPYDTSAYDITSGTYTLSAPPPPWYLMIDPPLVTAASVGQQVTINVDFNGVTTDGHITGVQFQLNYPSMLQTTPDLVVEGGFFKTFGDTFFTSVSGGNASQPVILAMVFLLPNATGQWNVFPQGSGVLATITFNVISLPATTTTFPITLSNVLIVDNGSSLVPYNRLENGAIKAPTNPADLNNDGKVDVQDLAIWAKAFGTTSTSPRWDPKADINGDGKVNILDGVVIAKAFG
jgi:hypothetical protein